MNNITEILLLCALAGLFVKGWHIVTRHGMLLSFLGFDDEKARIESDALAEDLEDEIMAISEEANQWLLAEEGRTTESDGFFQFKDNMELSRLRYSEKSKRVNRHYFLSSPWSECEICMSSIWGGGFFALHYSGAMWFDIYGFPIVAAFIFPICLAGLVIVIGGKKRIESNGSEVIDYDFDKKMQ